MQSSPLTPAGITEMVKANQAFLIDVRDISEVQQTGVADGAIHIPLMMINTKANPQHPEFDTRLDTSKPVYLYCASGGRSGMATQAMQQFGFTQAVNIGGLGNWVQAGGERVPYAA